VRRVVAVVDVEAGAGLVLEEDVELAGQDRVHREHVPAGLVALGESQRREGHVGAGALADVRVVRLELAHRALVDRPHLVHRQELDLDVRVPDLRHVDVRGRPERLRLRVAERLDLGLRESDLVFGGRDHRDELSDDRVGLLKTSPESDRDGALEVRLVEDVKDWHVRSPPL
jgi:hypothetical protein